MASRINASFTLIPNQKYRRSNRRSSCVSSTLYSDSQPLSTLGNFKALPLEIFQIILRYLSGEVWGLWAGYVDTQVFLFFPRTSLSNLAPLELIVFMLSLFYKALLLLGMVYGEKGKYSNSLSMLLIVMTW